MRTCRNPRYNENHGCERSLGAWHISPSSAALDGHTVYHLRLPTTARDYRSNREIIHFAGPYCSLHLIQVFSFPELEWLATNDVPPSLSPSAEVASHRIMQHVVRVPCHAQRALTTER